MQSTRVLRQAAHAAERTPLIRFIGKRNIPSHVDHTPVPHPASPTGKLPPSFTASPGNSHANFSSYRSTVQLHGPLNRTIGAQSGANLGPVEAPAGIHFDRSQLPARFRRTPLDPREIEAVETGGAALFG